MDHQPHHEYAHAVASSEKAFLTYMHMPTSKKTSYALEDVAQPSDMHIFQSADDHVAIVEQLNEGDHCFILRSDFRFTYALILKHDKDGEIELQVTEGGGTKSIPKDHWVKYIRTLVEPSKKSFNQARSKEGHDDGRRHERRFTMAGTTHQGSTSMRSLSSRGPKIKRSSMPNLGRKYSLDRSQSVYTREGSTSPSSSSSDHSSSSPTGVSDDRSVKLSFAKLPFDKDYKRIASNYVPSKRHANTKKKGKTSTRRLTQSMSQTPSGEGKRKDKPYKRSQSELNHCSSNDSSSSLSSIEVDALLRAQEDLDKLLAKSMKSLNKSMRSRSERGPIKGAFGDVKKIEILD